MVIGVIGNKWDTKTKASGFLKPEIRFLFYVNTKTTQGNTFTLSTKYSDSPRQNKTPFF